MSRKNPEFYLFYFFFSESFLSRCFVFSWTSCFFSGYIFFQWTRIFSGFLSGFFCFISKNIYFLDLCQESLFVRRMFFGIPERFSEDFSLQKKYLKYSNPFFKKNFYFHDNYLSGKIYSLVNIFPGEFVENPTSENELTLYYSDLWP